MSEGIHTSQIKQQVIKEIIDNIEDGKKVKELYHQHQEFIRQITPFDVLQIHAFLENSSYSDTQIIQMAPKIMNLLHEALETYSWNKEEAGPYIQMEIEEQKHIFAEFHTLKQIIKQENWFMQKDQLKVQLEKLSGLLLRFLRSQNILYPRLERHLSSKRPLQIMWTQQDRIRKQYQQLQSSIDSLSKVEYAQLLGQFFFLTMQTLDRERLLLLPVASFLLSKEELLEMYHEAKEIGYQYAPIILVSNEVKENKPLYSKAIDLHQIMDYLTVDITYVDKNDTVVYFNNPETRMFVRSKSVIGRKVQDCHPKESMHVVQEILDAFRQKKQKQAEFYIKVKNKMLYILYQAIYDSTGVYAGTLEISQDVTHIQSLTKEKRLLEWK